MKKSQGFSLIELIIYVAVLSVASAIFVATLFQVNLVWTRTKVESEVQQNLRFAMDNIAQALRSASAVASPTTGNSGAFLSATINGETVQYSLSGTVLQKTVGVNPAQNLTSDQVKVTYLNFTTLENSATTTGDVVTATATTSQFAMTVEYNADNAQFFYSQTATSTERIKN